MVRQWHTTLEKPVEIANNEYKAFLHYSTEFFLSGNQLWCKDHKGEHKLVVPPACRLFIMSSAHDNTGHHGFFATNALITL
jgi:hypothetical protein